MNATITAEMDGWRLDRALAALVPLLSRERIKTLISSGEVHSAGVAVRDPSSKARTGTAYDLTIPEPRESTTEAQDIPLEIVYEDDHLLVVDKPAGLVVHPAARNFDGTLVNALLYHCRGRLSGIGGVARPGIVHRIDKDTSGLLVVAAARSCRNRPASPSAVTSGMRLRLASLALRLAGISVALRRGCLA